MKTLNQIVEKINDLQTTNTQLSSGSFLFGDPWEYGASNQIVYPLLGCRLISSAINERTFTTSLNLFFCDKVHKDESNETEVLSDMMIASRRIYSELKLELERTDLTFQGTVNISANITPFTERFDDEVSGVEMNINIEQFFDLSTCT